MVWGVPIAKLPAIGMAWVKCDFESSESTKRSEKVYVRMLSVNEYEYLPFRQTHVPGGH